MAIDLPQEQLPDPRGISLARLISSEFGTSELTVRQQLGKQETVIEIGDEVWTGDRYFVPREKLVGRRVVILAPERHWSLVYPG